MFVFIFYGKKNFDNYWKVLNIIFTQSELITLEIKTSLLELLHIKASEIMCKYLIFRK